MHAVLGPLLATVEKRLGSEPVPIGARIWSPASASTPRAWTRLAKSRNPPLSPKPPNAVRLERREALARYYDRRRRQAGVDVALERLALIGKPTARIRFPIL